VVEVGLTGALPVPPVETVPFANDVDDDVPEMIVVDGFVGLAVDGDVISS